MLVILPSSCNIGDMASTPKTTAKRSRTTKKSTTAKVTKSAVLAHLRTARTANLKKGAKGYYTGEGAEILATAIARAFVIDPMSSEDITTGKSRQEAQARREYASRKKAVLVNFSDILGEAKEGEITHDRPENTVRARFFSICRAMGLPQDTLYAVRAESYREGETPQAYIVRK